jgi:queuine tRNA-ribosyltransferase
MPYRIVQFENGTASIEDTVLNEPMHSRIGPLAEAKNLYLDQSKLSEFLLTETERPLVIYDVGLGLAVNSLVCVETALSQKSNRKLEIHSFENEVAGIRFALENIHAFPFLETHRSMIQLLLTQGYWTSNDGVILWKLHVGDFRDIDLLGIAAPEIIFYDFHSPRTSPELWSQSVFEKIYLACKPIRDKNINTLLITYSSAKAVRTALSSAGFYVSKGIPTSAKRDTTLAYTLPLNRLRTTTSEHLQ